MTTFDYEPDDWITFRTEQLKLECTQSNRNKSGTSLSMAFKMTFTMIAELDYWVEKGLFLNRSEAVRYCIQTTLQQLK